MKKLLKLLSAALITAAMFMSCGNPAGTTVPDQDDGETVEQFRSKLLAFECGITASGNAVIIYEQGDSNYSEYIYIKKNGSWIQAGDMSLEHLKKEKNEFYITGDGQKIYTYTFTGNNLNLISTLPDFIEVFGSNTATFIKTATNNLPADLKTLLEKDDGETVEQFLQKLVEFGTGITSDGLLKFTYKRVLGKVYEAAYFYDNEKWTTGNPELDSDPSYNGNEIINNIRKISNNKYEQFGDGKTIYIYEFVNNNLQITWVIPELIQRFGTSSTFIKQ